MRIRLLSLINKLKPRIFVNLFPTVNPQKRDFNPDAKPTTFLHIAKHQLHKIIEIFVHIVS